MYYRSSSSQNRRAKVVYLSALVLRHLLPTVSFVMSSTSTMKNETTYFLHLMSFYTLAYLNQPITSQLNLLGLPGQIFISTQSSSFILTSLKYWAIQKSWTRGVVKQHTGCTGVLSSVVNPLLAGNVLVQWQSNQWKRSAVTWLSWLGTLFAHKKLHKSLNAAMLSVLRHELLCICGDNLIRNCKVDDNQYRQGDTLHNTADAFPRQFNIYQFKPTDIL